MSTLMAGSREEALAVFRRHWTYLSGPNAAQAEADSDAEAASWGFVIGDTQPLRASNSDLDASLPADF